MNPSKKKAVTMAVVAAVSAVMMGFTAIAAYSNVGGYEKVKNGLFNLVTTAGPENYTLDANMSLIFDGEAAESTRVNMAYADQKNYTETSYNDYQDEPYTSYVKDGYGIAPMDKRGWGGTATWYINGYRSSYPSLIGGMGGMFGYGEEISPAQKRFMFAMMDMLAGDTKNYFTEDNGHISCYITEAQVPEIFRAGLEIANEYAQRERDDYAPEYYGEYDSVSDYGRKLDEMLGDIRIETAKFDADVDGAGNLISVQASLSFTGHDMSGVSHTLTVSGGYAMTDIGTTAADLPNIIGEIVSFQGYEFQLTDELWAAIVDGNIWQYLGNMDKPFGDYYDEYYDAEGL